jgi:hypothetical protein
MAGTVTLATMLDVMYAVHLSSYVEAPFADRGGVMLVGPPAVFKSAMIDVLDRHYYNVVSLSDANTRTLTDLRGQMAQEAIRTLTLPEIGKLYERDPRVAQNVEGNLRALVAEGWRSASYEDARINRLLARCTIVGAMTPDTQEQNFKRWESTGFNRRFLWPLVGLEKPDVVERAVEKWVRIEFETGTFPPLPVASIPNLTTERERQELRALVKYQPGTSHGSQMMLLVKILAVLKWWGQQIGRPEEFGLRRVREFGRTLGRHGALLEVPEPRSPAAVVVHEYRRARPHKKRRGK